MSGKIAKIIVIIIILASIGILLMWINNPEAVTIYLDTLRDWFHKPHFM